jgi:transcriptional regulator with XRE-family HTH domain
MKMSNAIEILNRKFSDSEDAEITAMVNEELTNLRISQLIYQARTTAGLTQKELAKKINTPQSVIARMESANYYGHSLKTLQKIATALNKRICISFAEVEVAIETSAINKANQLSQLLHRKFDQWLDSGWQTAQSLGAAFQSPQFQYASARSRSAEPDLLEAEILVAENLANTDPNNPLASIHMAKKLNAFGCPMGLVVSVSQVSDCEPVNILLQLYALHDGNLPMDVCMTLLDEHGQPEHYPNAPNKIIEDRSNDQTPTIYLMFKYSKGDYFGVELSRGEVKVREKFFV